MILCSGCFDGVHAGHVAYLQAASRLCYEGERLLVAVAPDAYIFGVKGHFPHWSQIDRELTVHALKGVDRTCVHSDAGVADIILAKRPRLFVKGADWRDQLEPDVLAACQAAGTSILFVALRDTPHTHEALV